MGGEVPRTGDLGFRRSLEIGWSKNPEIGGVPKKMKYFCQKSDFRWGMEYISFFPKKLLFFSKNGPILGL
jgi:hypothetical protein